MTITSIYQLITSVYFEFFTSRDAKKKVLVNNKFDLRDKEFKIYGRYKLINLCYSHDMLCYVTICYDMMGHDFIDELLSMLFTIDIAHISELICDHYE